jgi:hypothetical protein
MICSGLIRIKIKATLSTSVYMYYEAVTEMRMKKAHAASIFRENELLITRR